MKKISEFANSVAATSLLEILLLINVGYVSFIRREPTTAQDVYGLVFCAYVIIIMKFKRLNEQEIVIKFTGTNDQGTVDADKTED